MLQPREVTPYTELDRAAWARLAETTESPLTAEEIERLRGLGDEIDMTEVREVYLPMSRILSLYVRHARGLHADTERFLGENRGDPERFAHAVVDAGADLVVGSGPHVLRGMEWYKGRLIAYSLGNFAGYKVFALGGPLSTSAILRVTLDGAGRFETGRIVPTRLVGAGLPALDPSEAAHGVIRTLSREDFGRRAVRVTSDGFVTR